MRHYVYSVIIAGITRYIGKGCGERAWRHERDAKLGSRRAHKQMREAFLAGATFETVIVRSGLDEAVAFDLEMTMIREIGRECAGDGPLWNLSEGGAGCKSDGARLRWKRPGEKERMGAIFSAALKKSQANKDQIKRLAANDDVKKKRADNFEVNRQARVDQVTELNRAKAKDPEFAKRLGAAISKSKASPEAREKMRRVGVVAMASPEVRRKIGDGVRAAWQRRRFA